MKRIAIDMDEVIADFLPKHLTIFNRKHHQSITIHDLHGKKLRDIRPDLREEILEILRDPGFFRDLEPMPHSQTVIRELSQSYEVFITTAAMEFPTSFTAKFEWLKHHFGFIDEMNYVFCGDKSIIQADYLVDDNVRHFERFQGRGVLFTAPHNIHERNYDRVNSWSEAAQYFQRRELP